jgi:hypothetical protein
VALFEQQAGEAAVQLRAGPPDGIVVGRAALGEQVKHRGVRVFELLQDGGGGQRGHGVGSSGACR